MDLLNSSLIMYLQEAMDLFNKIDDDEECSLFLETNTSTRDDDELLYEYLQGYLQARVIMKNFGFNCGRHIQNRNDDDAEFSMRDGVRYGDSFVDVAESAVCFLRDIYDNRHELNTM